MTAEAIGKRLKLTRLALGLSQVKFSELCGIAPNTYNQYETAKNKPDIEFGVMIALGVGVTLDWIYLGDHSGLRYDIADKIRKLRSEPLPVKKKAS